ncbi:13439_t:CDS:2 [Funneliformis caledonium]|uniref:13439_t:CDS:1 n=1 Tax=Funneliformis caledonium TaxID=1117310 RepID=A0A9N9D6T2_9GLOM|nr:13439_t:CDS:2 [Funneliformis caledonium]
MTTSFHTQSSRRSSETSLSDQDCWRFRSALKLSMLMWKKLPLILVEDVSYEEFEKKCEGANASKFWEYRDGTVVIFELPNRDHEAAHGEFTEQFLSAFANLPSRDKVKFVGSTNTQFWLAPNRVEDVIVLKLWKSKSSDQNGTPLRRLTCYKFCRRRSPRNTRGNYLPVQTIEFGNIDERNRPYNGCTAQGMCTLNISPHCIYRGCPRQRSRIM